MYQTREIYLLLLINTAHVLLVSLSQQTHHVLLVSLSQQTHLMFYW
jgi:hypothetical protein